MPKLYASNVIIKVLKRYGFVEISQKRSHLKMKTLVKPYRTVIIPANRKRIPHGTRSSIIRQSGIDKKEF